MMKKEIVTTFKDVRSTARWGGGEVDDFMRAGCRLSACRDEQRALKVN